MGNGGGGGGTRSITSLSGAVVHSAWGQVRFGNKHAQQPRCQNKLIFMCWKAANT